MIGGHWFFVYYLLSLSYHITATGAFQVQCPTSVLVGQATQCTWIRTSGDGPSFGLLLRKLTQDHGGTLLTTVRNTNQNQGGFQVTFPDEGQYLLEVVGNLDSVASNEVPQIFSSSPTITAAKFSGQPNSGSGSNSVSGSDTSSAGGGSNSDPQRSRPDTITPQTTDTGASTSPSRNIETPANTHTTTTQSSSSVNSPTTAGQSSSSNESGTSYSQSAQSSMKIPGNLFPSPSSSPASSHDGSSGNISLVTGGGLLPPTSSSTNLSSPPPTSSTTSTTRRNSKSGVIIGLTFGLLLLVLTLIPLLVFLIRRRRRRATSAFYHEKMGGRSLTFSGGSLGGRYGAFASGVGVGATATGALAISKQEENTSVPTTTGVTDGHQGPSNSRRSTASGSHFLGVSAGGGAPSGYAYSISESYSDRTSRTGSLDSQLVDLWRNARTAITGLTRTRTIQSGYSGDGDGNIRVDRSSSATGTHISFGFTDSSASELSFYPSPKSGESEEDGIVWVSPTSTTSKEYSAPRLRSSLISSSQAEMPSTVSSWNSNLPPDTPERRASTNTVTFPGTSSRKKQNLTVPGHSTEGLEDIIESHESFVSLLGLHKGLRAVPERITPELSSLNWDSTSSTSGSSIISYPPVSQVFLAYDRRSSLGRSDEY